MPLRRRRVLAKVRKNGNPTHRQPGAPNPMVACACGCGKTKPQFDDHGRPIQFLRGHGRWAEGTLAAPVLAALRIGVERPAEIAEKLGRDMNAISTCLTRLRAAGKAEPLARGRWRAVEPKVKKGEAQAA